MRKRREAGIMDLNRSAVLEMQIARTIEKLKQNQMDACYVLSNEKAVEQVRQWLHPGDVVACGGSMTLEECGVMELLRGGDYRFLDRNAPGLTREGQQEIYRQAFSADAYLCSANAITENGELYNVDGNSNRVAALLFGPKRVIVVAGYNKLVRDVEEAVLRVKRVSAPANALRLGCDTYCAKAGHCVSDNIGEGCHSQDRVCANYVVTAQQRIKNRICVVLVGEELGY